MRNIIIIKMRQSLSLRKSLSNISVFPTIPSFQCTRKLDSICNSDLAPTPNGLHHFQVGKGKTGPTYQYYRNPNVPDEVVYENHSKEHYRKVVLHSVLWPTALIGLSILIVTAAMCPSPTSRDYRRIP